MCVYTDLSAIDQASFAALYRATSQAVEKAFNEVTTLEDNSAAYFAYDLHALCQLKMLIIIDQRLGISFDSGSIILSDNLAWNATAWLYDLVFEALALRVVLKDKAIFHLIVRSRTSGGADYCDLRSLDDRQFDTLVAAFAEVTLYYGEAKTLGFRSPELALIAEQVNLLSALFNEAHEKREADGVQHGKRLFRGQTGERAGG